MRARLIPTVSAVVAAVVLSSCIVEAPTGESASDALPERALRTAAPPLSVKNGAILGNKVEIAGVVVQPGRLSPGEQVRISILFTVLEDLKDDYMVFVHVEDVDGRVERMNVDHRPNNGRTPTTEWKKGETIRDEFGLYLPPGLSVRGLNLWVGLWEPTRDQRLPVVNADKVRTDGNNRTLLVSIPVVP